MRKNAKKIFVVILLAIIACGSYFISGTYAKYSRALGGSDTAQVAKFTVTASGLNKTQDAEITLFDTIKEADTTTEETNVLPTKIAPGTGGQFTTTLTNASEVDVEAIITLSDTSDTSKIPIEYSLDKSTWTKATDTTDTIKLDYVGKASANLTEDVTIYWRWAFEGKDSTNYKDSQTNTSDTDLGEATTLPSITTTVTVTFQQVDD